MVASPARPLPGHDAVEGIRTDTAATVTTMAEFWNLADESKLNAQYSSDEKIAFLEHASAADIRKICIQYRYFVVNYPNNLATLVGRLPYGELKSILAEILAEELGSGEQDGAHIVWYDRFLRSIGVTEEELENSLYKENAAILDEIAARCSARSFEHVVGVCGMGGECLCQIYLTNMHKYLVRNAFIRDSPGIDWHFWTYHIGEADIEHRRIVRRAIDRMMMSADSVRDLSEGYDWGKRIWDEFWTNNYKETGVLGDGS